ncbi:MAG: EamA family transporter RarD [Firmicutes bacterium]|nr:EamA family transporter RarD [Bacillota bacterium]
MNSIANKKDYRQGLISVLGSSVWWGIMPIYWQWLKPIDSIVIIFYRIVLVALVCLIAALIVHKKEEILAPLKDKKLLAKLIIAGAIITLNLSLYIYAVNSENVIQSCIGYYIEPLVVCLFGMIFFGEKVNRHKAIALIMGAIGVVAVVFYFRQVPALALSIAFSFAIYAAIKKGLGMPPIISLLYETIFLAPIALGIVIYIETHGIGALAVATGGKYFLLMFCGLFTAFPLVLFANGANKTSMFILGLTEYISPTISLFLSIFYFKEEFYPVQMIAFAVIWTGLVFFTIGEYREYRNAGKN